MVFALCPDNGPPRIWRFVAGSELPEGVSAHLDTRTNILRVNKDIYKRMFWIDQHQLLRTHAVLSYYEMDYAA